MVDTKDTCKIILDKGTQKVKCFKFKAKGLKNRELAVHTDVDHKTFSTITDIASGLRLCSIQKEISRVTDSDIHIALDTFIRHYTLEEVLKRFKELDEIESK